MSRISRVRGKMASALEWIDCDGLRLDNPVAETATRTLIRQKQANRSRPNNQHIGIGSSMQHEASFR